MKRSGHVYRSVLFAAAMLLLLIGSFFTYAKVLKQSYQKEIISSLEEVSGQNRMILENEISRIQEILAEVSRRVGLYDPSQYSEAVGDLVQTSGDNQFKRMGIILPDGTAYTTDNMSMNLADREYFIRSMQGERCISDPLTDKIGNGGIQVYSVPVYRGQEITGVLFATYASDSMQKQLTIPLFHGQGYTYIVKLDGDAIVKSDSENSDKDLRNIFDDLLDLDPKNAESAARLKEDLAEGREGCIKFRSNGYQYMFYMPLPVNDWYLLTMAPATVLDEKMNLVLNRTYLLGIFLAALFLAIMLYVSGIQKQQKKQLLDLIYVDPVTGGYSYARFLHEAETLLKKQEQAAYAVIDLDIDDFKFINESFGYEEGDRLIRYIHKTLAAWCRPGEIYAHRTSDTFAAMIEDDDPEAMEERLSELSEALKNYFENAGDRISVVPSIGVFHIWDRTQPMDYCLDCAGIARKSVKGKYDAYYAFYDEAMKHQIYQEKMLESQMKPALENREFEVYYQPQYDTYKKAIAGAEALVRWRRSDGTLASPGTFIPLFEKNGFVTQLDEYMFREVCRQQRAWIDMGLKPVPVSVNLSRMQLYDLSFVGRYEAILKEYRLPVSCVEVEITESVFFDNQLQVTEAVDRLHKAGFVVLLDDFGTGYSSINMLQNMALDTIKIDKSSVDGIGDSRGDKVVDGILRLADSLGLKTVAEGVETMAQYEYLRAHGCDMIQGYYFARPMPADKFAELLRNSEETGKGAMA